MESGYSDETAMNIVKASINTSGGMDTWGMMKELSYNKDFKLLDSLGNVAKDFRQIHKYKYNPLHIHIQSIENGDTIITELVNEEYSRSINGRKIKVNPEALAKSINTSTYVVGIPFKLMDPGTVLKYEGELKLENDKMVDVVSASYNADKYVNHSTTDLWKYYFDKEDRRVLGNWVQTSDHYSMLENETYKEEGGILFNEKRKSYRVDEHGEKLFLRAAYKYYNYKVKF